jgi:flagellar biogenesis protein FliO
MRLSVLRFGASVLSGYALVFPAFAQQKAASGIPFRQEAEAAGPEASQWLLAALACVVSLALLVLVLRRFGFRGNASVSSKAFWYGMQGAERSVHVVERRTLTTNAQLIVVHYQQRKLLLAVGANFATCLRDEPLGAERGAGTQSQNKPSV